MREQRVRVAFVGIILAIPALMAGMSPRLTSAREAVLPVLATEVVLVAGLSFVARERRRLLAERTEPVRRGFPIAPHAARRSLRPVPLGREH